MSHEIKISHDLFPRKLALDIVETIKTSSKGLLVFGGGSTPIKINGELTKILESDLSLKQHFLENFKIFLSDERYVPLSNNLSNYKMLRSSLPPKSQIIPLDTNLNLKACIADYEEKLNEELSNSQIVLSLLGVGPDGHTASLFPNQYSLNLDLVIHGGTGPEGKDRLSLSPYSLQMSKKLLFIVNTHDKRIAYEKALKSKNKIAHPLLNFMHLDSSYFYLTESKE